MAAASEDREQLGLRVWSLFLRTHAAVVRRLERDVEDQTRLPLAWYDVLLELNAAPERRLRMQELGNRVVLSRTRVSRIVEELTRVGLACREPDPADRRGSFAVVTDAGRVALRSAAPVYLRGISEQFTAHATDDELRVLHDAFARVLSAQRADAASWREPPARSGLGTSTLATPEGPADANQPSP